MLYALDDTLHHLLARDMDMPQGAVDIVFDQPTREWSARLRQKPEVLS
jgi:hypothetical protein